MAIQELPQATAPPKQKNKTKPCYTTTQDNHKVNATYLENSTIPGLLNAPTQLKKSIQVDLMNHKHLPYSEAKQ
ncbi:hypothetical protein CHS0354_011637 [Potamilus streckersoni]|uniref:Uncharacterized protein n=1 Tax=Potamilus streckersoni TaxID=2493646 RepID=A0AAE0TMC8_9BIVA|nr:hypothetical protein CHS0354_011637 [Potamilus streckersoni]